MLIRLEQISVFQKRAEDDFVQRLTKHLRENYETTIVRLPDKESTVGKLSDEELDVLINVGIKRARKFSISYESAIAAFVAMMFYLAPNFSEHETANPHLKDENIEPNDRIDKLLDKLTREDWERIKRAYDVNAWKPNKEGIKE